MAKSRATAVGNNYPENSLVKPPKRGTQALSPAGMFGGKVPLRLAAQKSRPRAISAQCACLLSLQMGNKTGLDWTLLVLNLCDVFVGQEFSPRLTSFRKNLLVLLSPRRQDQEVS
jgi:hypothetical protein